ncbi:MAG TPA: S8 family serine peptidase [Flavisolibacter sp.]|jgi:hypothetical protein|nr:S8 family serine peptidase [Flavisolibacter sp.]
MKRACVCVFFSLIFLNRLAAQNRYIIQLRDKGSSTFTFSNPSAYLSQRAIARRLRYGIPLDSTDLPVSRLYIDSIRNAGNVTILNASRWLNSVTIFTTDVAALAKINSYSFVVKASFIAARTSATSGNKSGPVFNALPNARTEGNGAAPFNYGNSFNQIHLHNGEFLHAIGLQGQGMEISLLDAGYFQYTSLKAFDSVNKNGQVLDTWDFVNRENSVVEDDTHGMECFSIIAANIPGQFVGTAPKASFHLYRSEDASSEYPIEEHNWVCAAERADSSGGDLISSSLGYNIFDAPLQAQSHTYADMNGNTTLAAIGADLAARKGLLVLISAGNEGDDPWGKITTPADADSVLAVAAVTTAGTPAGFTSRGPSSDGQVKPDIASVGVSTVLQLPGNSIGTGNGTSFACPNIAGLATCLWQGFPEFNNMKIVSALRQAGNRFTTPNDTTGFGIPDMRKAFLILVREMVSSSLTAGPCQNTISFTSKDISTMKYEIERKTASESSFTKIGEVAAGGAVLRIQSYQFKDTLVNVGAGSISYRIRQIVDTSAAGFYGEYIDTLTVNLATPCITTGIDPLGLDPASITLLPNPAYDKVTIRFTSQEAIPDLLFRVTNAKGQLITTYKRQKRAGAQTFDITLATYPRGSYFISIYDKNRLLATKELIRL